MALQKWAAIGRKKSNRLLESKPTTLEYVEDSRFAEIS